MAVLPVSPTRMELTRIKKRLATAVKGHKLLKDKRDELMRRFIDLVREAKDLRKSVEEKMAEITRGFATAGSLMRKEVLASALLMPKQSVSLSVTVKSVMGADVPAYAFHKKINNDENAIPYGYAFTSGELDSAVSSLSGALPDLLALAQLEKTIMILAAEIEKTRRRVNALEYIMIPDYRDTIRFILMKMDENERGNHTRLMKVKDMMVEKQIESRRERLYS